MDDPRQSGLVETRRRVCVRSYLVVAKWELGLRGAGAAWVMYPGTACAWLLRVCGRGGVRQRHDHQGPTWGAHLGDSALAPSQYLQRRGLPGTSPPQSAGSGTQGGGTLCTLDQGKECGGARLAKGQRLQSALAPFRHGPRAGVAVLVCKKKFFPARRAHNMVLSWHHPGHL
jgi:hypothetical protein